MYGIDPASSGVASYDLSNDPNRLGILTQPGFLILRAAPAHVSIVDRGLMVMRVFLCQEMPAPPPGAAAQIDSIPTNLTDRDRFALHTAAPECAGCHDAFDPLGYPFEPFDFAGRFRTVDDSGNPLRSDGQIMLDGTLQSYADTASFAALLAASPTVQRCLVSKLYQYAMGRSLRDGESAVVDELAQSVRRRRPYLGCRGGRGGEQPRVPRHGGRAMKLSRRQFLGRSLRGAGGAAIALPFLLSREGSSSAQVGAPPERLITIYFGLGIPAILRNAGLTGVLAPLAPFASKLTMVQGLDCNASSPNNGHSHGSAGFACGFGTPVVSSKGGPSLDWVVHEAFRDPAGADTLLPTLSAGVSAGDNLDESIRYNHSWRGVNQPNLVILDTLALFETIFGAVPSLPPAGAGAADPVAVLRARQRVSVLDAVMADYRHVMSDAGGYSATVRATISSHLDTVRELERRAVAISLSLSGQGATLSPACRTPGTAPVQMHSFLGPPVGDLAPKTTPYFDAMWSVMVDLYVLALRCDLTRFGNLMVISGGDSYPFSSAAGQVDNIPATASTCGATRRCARSSPTTSSGP